MTVFASCDLFFSTFCILKGLNIHLLFLYKIICIYKKKDIWGYTFDPLIFFVDLLNKDD